ncbi:MAG: aminotransferase class III-fold pyridoxal phosphate-dependent enzyme [Pseudonocardia sp.]|nr:aminotransferase class III-fold pyridoxal phosphate-dependent enzyme [Pseudonocardia sp.]
MRDAHNVWPHFGPLTASSGDGMRTMVRGEGAHLTDDRGHRFIDLLSALYCVNAGHGRTEIGQAMAKQAAELAFFPSWGSTTTPVVAELAERIVSLAANGFERVFFTSGGSDSVDAAWKLSRQYHRLRGKDTKYKILSKEGAYHGTTLGALSVTGIPSLKEPFGPLVPGAVNIPRVKSFRAPSPPRKHAADAAAAVAEIIEAEGPDSVAAIIVEPVQNSGGCLVSDPVYFRRLREIADHYDVLLISDETICSWGRTGAWFGSRAVECEPDIITTAKGLTSGYAPMGALIARSTVTRAFTTPGTYFNHGLTFGGHPVSAAAAMANIAILEREELVNRACRVGARFRAGLETLTELDIVGDVRGQAMFQAIELVADNQTNGTFSPEQTTRLVEFLPKALFEGGLICRAMHRGAPVIQFAPPLVITDEDLNESIEIIRASLKRAQEIL